MRDHYFRPSITVAAFRFTEDAERMAPDWFVRMVKRGQIVIDTALMDGAVRVYGCTIDTPHGKIHAKNGEWILYDEELGRHGLSVMSSELFKRYYMVVL